MQEIYLFTCSLVATESSERSRNNRVGVEKFGESKLQIERDRNFVEEYDFVRMRFNELHFDVFELYNNHRISAKKEITMRDVLNKFLRFIPIFTM